MTIQDALLDLDEHCYDAIVDFEEHLIMNSLIKCTLSENEQGIVFHYNNKDIPLPSGWYPSDLWQTLVRINPIYPYFDRSFSVLVQTPVDTTKNQFEVTRRNYGVGYDIQAQLMLDGGIFIGYPEYSVFYKPYEEPWQLLVSFNDQGEMLECTTTHMLWEGEIADKKIVAKLSNEGLEMTWGGEPTTIEYLDAHYLDDYHRSLYGS